MYPNVEKDICSLLGISNLCISHYAIDSRQCRKGSCFFALEGAKSRGVDFLLQVSENGGVAAVVPAGYKGPDYGLVLRYVDDVEGVLKHVAKRIYAKRRACVVGVTGSVGKTTIKEFTATVLGDVYRSPASYNSQLTLPLCVLNCPEDAKLAVLEYGMSQKGEMQKLCAIAPPDLGIVGPIAFSHAANFSSLDEIAQEKLQLVKNVRFAAVHSSTGGEGMIYDARNFAFRFPFTAPHLIENAKAAICIAQRLRLSDEKIQAGLDRLKVVERRGTISEIEGVTYYNDSYNANVASIKAALLACPVKKRQVVVLGSMLELGAFTDACHREVGEMLKNSDEVFCIGEECRVICEMLGDKARYFEKFEALEDALKKTVKKGDVVLVKGSNAHRLWRLIP